MNPEFKNCKKCAKDFRIETEDFAFYAKMHVPPPTLCPECRKARRLAWRNDFYFYPRTCDLCKKNIISLYSADKPFPVYCVKCWHSDAWNPRDHARDVDLSRSFIDQAVELQNKVPRLALINDDGIGSVNSEYTTDCAFSKNCYMVMVAWKLEDCMYGLYIAEGKNLVDCVSVFAKSEYVYDSVFFENCYRSKWIYYSNTLTECAFCYDCRDSSNCFMSVGLRHKKYCFKNEQYSKEEYEKIVESYRLDTREGVERARKEFEEFILGFPRRFANLRNSVHSTGNDLTNCKNAKQCFNARRVEDSKYFEDGDSPKDVYDVTTGGECERCYECLTPDHSQGSIATIFSWKNSSGVSYSENCHSSHDLLGCAGLKKAEYSILNKQYSKEEYEVLREKIIEDMKKRGEWGEFFPAKRSPFGYNESNAQRFVPLSKEEAESKGFAWQEKFPFTQGKETVLQNSIPSSIHDVPDSFSSEIFGCVDCSRNYRILPAELAFYKNMGIPLPDQCFYCRLAKRITMVAPRTLYRRTCMCKKEVHSHGTSACVNEFETSYSPDRPEIVYCEPCYTAEVA